MEIGVLLNADQVTAPDLVALAATAETGGIRIALVAGSRYADPWTTVAWVTGMTESIRVGALDPQPRSVDTDPVTPVASVYEKSLASLTALAPDRTIPVGVKWSFIPTDAGIDEIRAASRSGIPVAEVRTSADVERLALLIRDAGDTTTSGPHSRPAIVAAQRVDGIDYDGVPASLAARAVEPGDAEHRRYASTYLRGGSPGLVLRPQSVEEVSDAIAYAREHRHLPLGIRSAGHGISGRSTNRGGLVISVGDMNGLEVLDHSRRLVRIGPGRTWKQVAHSLAPYGWALGSGDYGGVGVGGLATAGGIGLLGRNHGLTIDHLRAVELVLADGTPIRASATENPDLFWAVRGAGANFGIATAFEFEVYEVGEVGWAQLVLVTDDIETSLRLYGEIASQAPRDTTVFLVTGRQRSGQWVVSLFGVVDDPDPEVVVSRLTPFLKLGQVARQPEVVMTPYTGVMDNAVEVGPDGQQGFGEPVSRSAFIPELTADFARDTAALLSTDLVYFLELRAMGGAISDVPSDAMAFSHRTPKFQIAAMSSSDDRLSEQWERLHRHFDGTYLSFETDRRPERLTEAFPPEVLARLRRLKAKYDPTNLFRDNFNIEPNSSADADDETTQKAGAA